MSTNGIGGKAPISMHTPAPSTSAPSTSLPPSQQKGAQELQPNQKPQTTAENVVAQLKGKGLEAPPTASKDLAAQLAGALKELQKQQGLPQTGLLGGKTNEVLKNIGAAGAPPQEATPGPKPAKDDFERGAPSLLKQGEKGRAELAKNATPDTNFLDALLNKLGGEHGVTADKQGYVGGAQNTSTETAKTNEAKEAKKLNEADNKTGSTSDAKKAAKEESNQQLDKAKDSKVHVARGLKAEQTKTEEQKRKDALKGKNPTEKGILEEEEEDEDADEGQGGEGKNRGKGGNNAFAGAHGDGSDTAGEDGEKDGNEKFKGNASSGDEQYGEKRGRASIDGEGDGDDVGHYRVPSLAEQAAACLERIQKDPSVANRATTYSVDVMFYKPGVYAMGQKAQELVHLVVPSATAFDPVWQKMQANLQIMVRKLEPQAPVPSLDDIVGALRAARARDGGVVEKTPLPVGKLVRPPGRA